MIVTLWQSQPCEAGVGEESELFSEQQTSSKYLLVTFADVAGNVASRFFQLEISVSRSVVSMDAHT